MNHHNHDLIDPAVLELALHATPLQRRRLLRLFPAGVLTGLSLPMQMALAAGLSNADASSGLRAALERGAQTAVASLGQNDGFLGNPKVRIPLPDWLEQPARLLRTMGQGAKLDELVTTMNRAAEAAVPEAKPVLVNAVKSLNITDARKILGGGDNSVTEFFSEKTRAPLGDKFLPIVARSTARLDLAGKINGLMERASQLGLIKGDNANVEHYVTGKTLDGLYMMIGEEERKIRQDPIGTGSAILKKVFGSL